MGRFIRVYQWLARSIFIEMHGDLLFSISCWDTLDTSLVLAIVSLLLLDCFSIWVGSKGFCQRNPNIGMTLQSDNDITTLQCHIIIIMPIGVVYTLYFLQRMKRKEVE